ncbi:Isoamylase 3, chloroplastic [Nymphon striatum]|nr:Isoamylase 3, chloroplastic [Nymphon striatum]
MHVDGFRFDLASILGRDQDGSVLASPPLLEQIAGDPVLADTKLIAEAWDAAGLYQVGSFPNWGRWAEWNGRFRDDIRGFVRGESAHTKHLATRLAGSADLYQSERDPGHGINFITSHDGFSLADLVAYNDKHNEANGESNNDGDNHNLSWNCGVEGNTDNPEILALRDKQIRNLATLLMLSRGVPMILSGDEIGRSQSGNNNAYCQDSKLSWMDWSLLHKNKGLHRFFRLLIEFRKEHELLRHNSFEVKEGHGAHITWHGQHLGRPDWGDESRSLAMHLAGKTESGEADDIYLITSSHWEDCKFDLPQLHNKQWFRFVDTSLEGDAAITGLDKLEPLIHHYDYSVSSRSTVVLLAKVSFASGCQPASKKTPVSKPKPAPTKDFTQCNDPRPEMCTQEYLPVCASVDTGIRCVTTPCPTTKDVTYSNACTACSDSKVHGYTSGACE